jgi:hypothetical protein
MRKDGDNEGENKEKNSDKSGRNMNGSRLRRTRRKSNEEGNE